MTKSEWFDITRVINANWPHRPISDVALAKYYDDLKDLHASQVRATVEVLHREGREWPPTGGHIIAKLAELTVDAPDWAVAAATLRRLLAYPDNVHRGGQVVDARAERLAREHPLLQAFVNTVGWGEIRCAPQDDRTAEAQLRTKWERYVRAEYRSHALAGLPAAGLPALERVARRRELRAAADALALPAPTTAEVP